MSEVVDKFNLGKACKYNKRANHAFPQAVLDQLPLLASPSHSEAFAWEVVKVQRELGFDEWECDGKLGNQTYKAILSKYQPITEEYIVQNGCRIHLPKSDLYELITFDEPTGLDLHKFGNFSRRSTLPRAVCMHWGGLNPKHCFNVFASTARQVSSHFLIGLVDGKPVVYQVLDMGLNAWHGGWVNDHSIGVDVCQSPLRQWKEHYDTNGYNVEKLDNTTGRGPKALVTVDPRIADATNAFIEDLFEALGWDFVCPDDHEVYKDTSDFTIFGHHHVNERKYDIAPWWDTIFGALDDEL
jgi:hypothetical protein